MQSESSRLHNKVKVEIFFFTSCILPSVHFLLRPQSVQLDPASPKNNKIIVASQFYPSIHLSNHPLIDPSSHPSIDPFKYPAICPTIELFSHLSTHPTIHPSIYLSKYSSIIYSIHPSINHPSIYPSSLTYFTLVEDRHICADLHRKEDGNEGQ